MFARIDADLHEHRTEHAVEIHRGDYVDHGPRSRDVLDLLIRRNRTRDAVFLKGNHESIALDFTSDPAVLRSWGRFGGGLETLITYGLRPSVNPSDPELAELSQQWCRALDGTTGLFWTLCCPVSIWATSTSCMRAFGPAFR
nr:metallophosphoesterase [Rhodoplanes roseus]